MAFLLKKQLENAYKTIKKSLGNPDASDWITDNFYIIDRHYRFAVKNRKALKFNDFYRILKRFCELCDYSPEPSSLVKHLKEVNRDFSYDELCACVTLLSVCAITEIADIIDSDGKTKMLSASIKMLISLSDPDYGEITSKLWRVEKLVKESEREYENFDDATKSQYRALISNYAKAKGITEREAATKLISEAKKRELPLGKILFSPDKKGAVIWISIITAVVLALSALSFSTVGWITLLLFVPFCVCGCSVADMLTPFFINSYKAPRIRLDKVPNDSKTLVTVATLMTGGRGDSEVFDSLLKFRYMNPDENIYFCVLADFPDSDRQTKENDEEIIKNAKRKIDELNRHHGNRFCMLFRKRVLNKSENRFGGWERKRGAVCELVNHISNGGNEGYYGGDFIKDIKYILTLDSDTNLSVGSVTELLSVALHPANRPVVKRERVVSGYGIIQPSVRTELSSAYKTGFSRLVSGSGGADAYATASFHRSQTLFGSGNFCGKGLIDVRLFASLVSGKMPEGIVLSHDVVEGSVLRTLCASDITLTDSTPGNTVSFFRRLHRWIRGDFQNLSFLKGGLLDRFSKWRLVLTVLRHSSCLFILSAVIIGAFLTETDGLLLLLLAYSEFLIPFVLSLVHFLFSGSPFGCMRFFSKAYSLLTHSSMRLFFEISSSCRKAALTLNAFLLAAFRMKTRKKTLEWTTAAQTEKLSSSLGKYVVDSASSVIVGLLLLALARPPFLRLLGIFYFVYPLVSTVLAKPLDGGAETVLELTEKQKRKLVCHASDMFGFYNDNVGEQTNHLPPDNIQFSPVYSVALRTSPTNIGFYLVSLLAARDLGLIDSDILFARLDKTLSVVEKLPKYKGNLYNWYDLKTLSVIGDNYVSTVDCGNFTVMLVALKEGLTEYQDEEERLSLIMSRCDDLLNNADLTPFYDKKRDLFRIGLKADTEKCDNGCYDLLMSEARMTAYYAVAKSIVPKKHWQSLGRTLTHKSGYIGMKSWSGTAFEYLMPQLFLPLYKDSFLYESIAFSIMVQRNENPIWGVSESGFYSFDGEMNYQYKANGLRSLSLRRIGNDERVISPYSTYLSLCICRNAAIKNLSALENRGMYGKYGLYEALDFNNDSGGICVKSYMAHHVGMSIIACMNAVNKNSFVKRFMRDMNMFSAKELLQEKIPIDAHIFEDGEMPFVRKRPLDLRSGDTEKTNLSSPSVMLLNRGDMTALISGNGHIGLQSGERLLANTQFDRFSMISSPTVVFSRNNQHYTCVPLCGEGNFSFERGNDYCSHIASGKDFSGRTRYSISKNCNCFIINTRAESLKKYDISFVFEPVLEQKKKFLSHASFSRLFVESEYDKTKKILYFHRRSGLDGHHIFTVAVAVSSIESPVEFLTSRESFKSFSVDSPIDYAKAKTDNKTGACIDPLCLLRCVGVEGGKTTFLLTCGETKNECERNIRLARASKEDYRQKQTAEIQNVLLPKLLYEHSVKTVDKFSETGISDLWSKSISGDYPIVTAIVNETAIMRTETLINTFLYLSRCFVRFELVFVISDEDNYNRPNESSVKDCIFSQKATQYVGRNGGIFIIRASEVGQDVVKGLKNVSCCIIDYSKDLPKSETFESKPLLTVTSVQNKSPLITSEHQIRIGNGYFENESYTVDKTRLPDAPYSFILSGCRFSTVVTQSSLGYTFFDNARERRICSFSGDSKALENGERIFAEMGEKRFDLCACSHKVVYQKGFATYYGEINGKDYKLTVAVDPKFPIKLIKVQYPKGENIKTVFELKPVIGDSVIPINGIEAKRFSMQNNSCVMFKNVFGMTFPEGRGFAGVCGGSVLENSVALCSENSENVFFLGAATTENAVYEISSLVDKRFFDSCVARATDFASSLIPQIKIKTDNKATDLMMNFFVPYQVAACRFFARGSFYQSGGAYGFRDQLQDSLALIYSNPNVVRTHLIRCCAHQYLEGRVMHWWHTKHYGRVNRGIKSKCSDDMLYLPLVAADYFEKTGDAALFDVEVNYLVSPELGNENERYEQPELSDVKESVYLHCLRALAFAEQKGRNGLLLMGSCDWNDAFSLVGAKGVGESVFSTLLFIVAAERFMPIMEHFGDNENLVHYKETVKELKNVLETTAYFEDRYARAICDDGTVLGIKDSEECEIDILSQAFAAIADLDNKRTKNALKLAFSKLYEPKTKVFRLFSPAFGNGKAKVGYIRGYVSGIRENGGQYTHGALWGALGMLKCGLNDEALRILECANPCARCEDKNLARLYKAEPYAIAADVYSGEFSGRGGWSWYTGAAAWFYKITLENVFGLRLGADQTIISAKPIIPFEAEIKLGNAELRITASRETEKPLLDGQETAFPLKLPNGDHSLDLPLE